MQKRISGFQLLRGILICCVVLFHSLSIFVSDYAGHAKQTSGFLIALRTFIGTFQMPIFMALSGFLFYWSIKSSIEFGDNDLRRFVKKKIKRLIIPFFVIMFFWRKPLLLIASRNNYAVRDIREILVEYIRTTTTGGLWFLYVLFSLFVIHYLILRGVWRTEARLLILLLFSICVSTGSFVLSGPIHHILFYNLYFFAGAYLNHFLSTYSEHTVGVFYLWSRVLFVVSVVLSMFYAFDLIQNPLLKAALFTIIACFDIMFVIPLFYNMNWFNKALNLLGRDSMGVYLLHEPLMICIGSFLPSSINGVMLSLILFIVGVLGSICMVHFIRELKLGFVIGES